MTIKKLIELFDKHKIVTDNGCWELDFASNMNGYSAVWNEGKFYYAHRISAAYHLGMNLDDKEQQTLHKNECFNRKCWNPEHLYIGNNSDNVRDSFDKGRTTKADDAHCRKCGFPYSKENTKIFKNYSGREYRQCINCKRKAAAKWNAKRAKARRKAREPNA